ncbi:PREDICTED: pentatricopeptide repeat-containing protein At3g60050-like isoform X1 [Camelina sativa]|uniref:Pentatricopeptide repeat-containing protein At3g60050-like isoform X1 n=1 Tax=Camelina sativa TaxID=90675 RepID=A0ABM0WCU2_CAMSA|nr:PREDICTED: pentatricopeptide repeat-containing protein At3g60050-like isoform X1 [Camelina sativa]
MNLALVFGTNVVRKAYRFLFSSRKFCNGNLGSDETHIGFTALDLDCGFVEEASTSISELQSIDREEISVRCRFLDSAKLGASRVLETLKQDDSAGFDTKSALDELNVRVSGLLVREVLVGFLRNLSYDNNKTRCAKLAYRFFMWSGEQDCFRHTVNSYHLLMKIFAECGEYKAMWRLVDEMVQDGLPTTARTFNLLICSCGEAGLAKQAVVQFIKSKTFNYRPFKHSYNAILNSLLGVKQYKLIEWVYEQMLEDGFSPDVLTYNILLWTNYRLGKMDRFDRLFDEMARDGLSLDCYTYNILLHILGKGNKPLAALTTLNHMKEVGIDPSVLHFTTLIDGLSRAGNMEACKYFLDEMVKAGCAPDVVCYTVMITGYVVSGELEKAKEMFKEMTVKGQLPNVFTYNSMIRGLCMAGEFREACWLLKEMESRGCNPNFVVYSTLVSYLRKAGKLTEARKVIREMVKKGHYVHLVPKMMKYRR